MSGKTAFGLVLIVFGIASALWGLSIVTSEGWRFAARYGLQNNTAPLAIAAGIAFGLIGLVLSFSKSPPAEQVNNVKK